jgi:hypothetical protein
MCGTSTEDAMTRELFTRVLTVCLACCVATGCVVADADAGHDPDGASVMDVVPAEEGKANGSVDVVSGYIIYPNVYYMTSVEALPIPAGWVTLYSFLGNELGRVDVDSYRSEGTVSRLGCEAIREFRHPFYDGRLRYDAFMCKLVLSKPKADPHGYGWVLIEYEEIDEQDGSLTGEIVHPYVWLEGNNAMVTIQAPVNTSPDPRSTVLVSVGVGTSFDVDYDALTKVRVTDDYGSEAELRYQYVQY